MEPLLLKRGLQRYFAGFCRSRIRRRPVFRSRNCDRGGVRRVSRGSKRIFERDDRNRRAASSGSRGGSRTRDARAARRRPRWTWLLASPQTELAQHHFAHRPRPRSGICASEAPRCAHGAFRLFLDDRWWFRSPATEWHLDDDRWGGSPRSPTTRRETRSRPSVPAAPIVTP